MNIKTKNSIALSLALMTTLGLGLTGCGGGSGGSSGGTSTGADVPVERGKVYGAVDVTVERGKVYGAIVTDSSAPAQRATQKSNSNVYTFAQTPTYPIVVTGGWIDVNNDGIMDVSDVKLDITMKSYTNVVTPVSTYIADANETVREQKLADLAAQLNTAGVGAASNVTVDDLLKVPSEAPRDVMVLANAIFKDIKETNATDSDVNTIMTQFNAVNSAVSNDANATEVERAVMTDLKSNGLVTTVTYGDISQNQLDNGVALSAIAQALIDGRITSDHYLFNTDMGFIFTADFQLDFGAAYTETWMVQDNVLTISGRDGDKTEVIFESANPSDGSTITVKEYYGSSEPDIHSGFIINIAQPATTEPSTGSGDTTGGTTTPTTVDLSAYSDIFIYKNVTTAYADELTSAYTSYPGFDSESTSNTTSCTDFGFSNPTVSGNMKTYINTTPFMRHCTESDYSGVVGASGTSNVIAYYQ